MGCGAGRGAAVHVRTILHNLAQFLHELNYDDIDEHGGDGYYDDDGGQLAFGEDDLEINGGDADFD